MNNVLNTIRVKDNTGAIKEVEIINTYKDNNNEYALYAIDNGDDTSSIYATKIVVNNDGSISYEDVDATAKSNIIKFIQESLSKEQ